MKCSSCRWLLASLLLIAAEPSLVVAEDGVVHRSNNPILKLTDGGPIPAVVHMSLADSVMFILNETRDSLTTIDIDFGKRVMHCSGGNTEVTEQGLIRSKRPFGPRDFASTCFHEPGTYMLTAYGIAKFPNGVRATIVVQ